MAIRQQIFTNNAKTTLALPITASDTSATLVDGSKFPQPSAGQYFLATLDTGSIIEIVEVTNRVGNILTIIRAQEGTIASNFPSGTMAEVRVTSATLASFAKTDTVMSELASIESLTSPATSNGNSYICSTLDDGGNPTIAIKNGSVWRFSNYNKMVFSGTVHTTPVPTLSTVEATVVPSTVNTVSAGKFLIQFISGNNVGIVRSLTSHVNGSLSWSTDLGIVPVAGDQFEVYQSTTSTISDLEAGASNAIIYSILLGE